MVRAPVARQHFMNDTPTSTEMVFCGFLLVFGIIAGIGIQKQMNPKLPKVTYEHGNGWKTGGAIDRVEGVWFTNRVPDTLVSNIYITHPEPRVAWPNTPVELSLANGPRILLDTKTGYLWVWENNEWISTNRVNMSGPKLPDTNIVITVTNTGDFQLKLDEKELDFPAERDIRAPSDGVIILTNFSNLTKTNAWLSIHRANRTLFEIATNKFGYYIRSSLRPHVSLTNNTEFPW